MTWNPVKAWRRRKLRKAMKVNAGRKRSAWRQFDDRLEAEYRWATGQLGGYSSFASLAGRSGRSVEASYDSAQTTTSNSRHWAQSDNLSVNAANAPAVRNVLRKRARYEVANNSYARGILLTLANDVIGTCPTLQLDTGDPLIDTILEGEFVRWARAVRLGEKLRTARLAKAQDGEAFLMLTSNPKINSPIKLDLKPIEADQVATPTLAINSPTAIDGIEYDDDGNPEFYHLLKSHPGDGFATSTEFERVPAASMIHLFRADRPGQRRGIPEITPALPLFAQCRRYTLAVLDAAESAANFAIMLYTELPPDTDPDLLTPLDTWDIERNQITALPPGYKAGQMKAEQPATTYEMFKIQLLSEVARCVNMPKNIALADSSGYSFATTQADSLIWNKTVQVEEADIGIVALDHTFDAWIDEALKVLSFENPQIAASNLRREQIGVTWVWDGRGAVNPVDAANARRIDLEFGMTTYESEYAKQGKDWEVEHAAQAKALGITLDEYRKMLTQKLLGDKDVTEVTSDAAERDAQEANR